ncbi:MAG: carboxypeptidase-like regulatory domain-containing protein, partial [Deltaproteobacteria bacterium]|nr:carboxypeptidase-like regulatory domain-containing protein [Deltaproteobacteria bacterium]
MGSEAIPSPCWWATLQAAAVGGPAIIGSVAYLAQLVSPEAAAVTTAVVASGTLLYTSGLGQVIVRCPYVSGKYIGGQLSTATDEACGGVTITYTGTTTGTVTTRADGSYATPWLERGGSYTIRPAHIPFHDITPVERDIPNLTTNMTAVDFTATRRTVELEGVLTFAKEVELNVGGSSIIIEYEGPTKGRAKAANDGSFSLPGLYEGGQYTITPLCPAHHIFHPANAPIDGPESTKSRLSFHLERKTTSLSGVVEAGPHAGRAGLQVKCSGPTRGSTQTDDKGAFTLTNLLQGGKYTVTIGAPAHHRVTPRSLDVEALPATLPLAFKVARTLVAAQGKVSPAGTEEVAGLTITYRGETQGTTKTTKDGTFTLPGLLEGSNYTVMLMVPKFHRTDSSGVPLDAVTGGASATFRLERLRYCIRGKFTGAIA